MAATAYNPKGSVTRTLVLRDTLYFTRADGRDGLKQRRAGEKVKVLWTPYLGSGSAHIREMGEDWTSTIPAKKGGELFKGWPVEWMDWREEREENPAVSGEQYRLAQAVLSGTAQETGMTKRVAREIVEKTPARMRGEFMRENPQKWILPFRRGRKNYEDVGHLPFALEHDIGFSGSKMYRPVKVGEDNRITVGSTELSSVDFDRYSRKSAVDAIKKLKQGQGHVSNPDDSPRNWPMFTTFPDTQAGAKEAKAIALKLKINGVLNRCELEGGVNQEWVVRVQALQKGKAWGVVEGRTKNPSDSEARAREIGNDPKKLMARLQEAKSILVRPGSFGKGTFDFAKKRLVSEDGSTALQWRLRRHPDQPESYENQQTDIGSVSLTDARKRNPEDSAASFYESFHGEPSEEVLEFAEEEKYHSNLAALGVLVEMRVTTLSGYEAEICFEDGDGARAGNGLFSSIFGPSSSKASDRLGPERKTRAKKTGKLRDWSHGMSVAERKAITEGWRKHKASASGSVLKTVSYRGHRIEETEDGFTIPEIDSSVFDTLKDAKEFVAYYKIGARATNPGNAQVGELWEYAYRARKGGKWKTLHATSRIKSISGNRITFEDGRAIQQIAGDGGEELVRRREQNPSSVPAITMLCSNEAGTQLYLVGGDQSLDLKALHMSGDKWEKDSMVIGDVTHICYHARKVFGGKAEEFDYEHEFSEDDDGPLPQLRYDKKSEKLHLDGGSYVIKQPLLGTSPGIEN